MRGDTEIAAEIVALKQALKLPACWNPDTRKTLAHSVRVLELRMSAEAIDADYYVDETSSEYEDGDNDLFNELMRVHAWLQAEKGYKAPSEGL